MMKCFPQMEEQSTRGFGFVNIIAQIRNKKNTNSNRIFPQDGGGERDSRSGRCWRRLVRFSSRGETGNTAKHNPQNTKTKTDTNTIVLQKSDI